MLTTPHFTIRTDLQTRCVVPPTQLNVDLPRPLENILSVLPTLDELLYYATQSAANLDLLPAIKDNIQMLLVNRGSADDTVKELDKPFAIEITQIKTLLPVLLPVLLLSKLLFS